MFSTSRTIHIIPPSGARGSFAGLLVLRRLAMNAFYFCSKLALLNITHSNHQTSGGAYWAKRFLFLRIVKVFQFIHTIVDWLFTTP